MIYAEKEKNESPFVSVNTLTRGRVLSPTELAYGIYRTPSYQAKEQTEQSRATAVELQEDAASSQGSGQSLPDHLQPKMEETLGMDFTAVRLHHDAQSATMAESLDAKAFTHGEDIYFNQGEYQPETTAGEKLLAHELTHVKQQKTISGLQMKLQEPLAQERYEQEADAVADTVVGSFQQLIQDRGSAVVSSQSSGQTIQLKAKENTESNDSNWLLEQVSGLVRNIPGYDLLALAIGRDPLTGKTVQGNGMAWGKAVMGLIPGGAVIFENLEKAGVIERAVTWLKAETEQLEITFAVIKDLFDQAWSVIVGPRSPEEKAPQGEKTNWFESFVEGAKDLTSKAVNVGKAIFNAEESFNQIKQIFLPPINRIISFISNAGLKLMEFVFEGGLTLANAPVEKVMSVFLKTYSKPFTAGCEIFLIKSEPTSNRDWPVGFLVL